MVIAPFNTAEQEESMQERGRLFPVFSCEHLLACVWIAKSSFDRIRLWIGEGDCEYTSRQFSYCNRDAVKMLML